MGVINLNFQNIRSQETTVFYDICTKHPGCADCPLIARQPYDINGNQIICETGRNKKKE